MPGSGFFFKCSNPFLHKRSWVKGLTLRECAPNGSGFRVSGVRELWWNDASQWVSVTGLQSVTVLGFRGYKVEGSTGGSEDRYGLGFLRIRTLSKTAAEPQVDRKPQTGI